MFQPKASEVLFNAAYLCEKGTDRNGGCFYGCNAISVTLGGRNHPGDPEFQENGRPKPYRKHTGAMTYLNLMRPKPSDLDASSERVNLSPTGQGYFGHPDYPECQDHRVLALCMAAILAEDEGN